MLEKVVSENTEIDIVLIYLEHACLQWCSIWIQIEVSFEPWHCFRHVVKHGGNPIKGGAETARALYFILYKYLTR